jgi:TonB-dependent SusC/RagA subfamily outer membrane receptor
MENFLLYLAKVALSMGAFFLVYLALFQNQKQFLFNRIYLPVSLVISFLIPLITFTKVQYIQPTLISNANNFAYLPDAVYEEPVFTLEWYHYLIGIYCIGIVIFLFNLLTGHIKAINIISKSRNKKLYNININLTKKDVHPFSFFKRIVLSENTMDNPNLEMIIDHEKVHVNENHTIDILIAEILFLFQWFNPFAWLIRDAMRTNLEYLADDKVTQKHNAETYQLAMVGLAHKQNIAPFLTALNGSQLKNRIIMMKKKTENRYSLLKQLVVLPLLALLIMSMSNKEVKTEIAPQNNLLTEISDSGNNGASVEGLKVSKDILADTIPLYVINGKVINGKIKDIPADNIESMDVLKGKAAIAAYGDKGKNGVVIIKTKDNDENDEAVVLENELLDLVDGDNNTAHIHIPVTSSSNIKFESTEEKKALYIVDGVKYDGDINEIDSKNIQSVNIIKDNAITAKYGEEAKNGVIEIITKKNTSGNSVYINSKNTKHENPQPLYVVDGEIYRGDIKDKDIPADNVESINVLKDKSAIDKYGDDGKNGVIEITTKKGETKNSLTINNGTVYDNNGSKYFADKMTITNTSGTIKDIKILDSNDNKTPLYVVDGKPYDGDIKDIPTDNVESVNVLKGDAATAVYGTEGGKNGVIEIKTKEKFGGKHPTIYLNGEKYDGELNDIPSDNIKSINVFKDKESGKEGVIKIETKDYTLKSDLEVRKYIAKNIKYPAKAQKAGVEGEVKLYITFDDEGNVVSVSEEKIKTDKVLDEVVVVGYALKDAKPSENASIEDLINGTTPLVKNMPTALTLRGKTVKITVKFMLQ